jgi:hypothetical protein
MILGTTCAWNEDFFCKLAFLIPAMLFCFIKNYRQIYTVSKSMCGLMKIDIKLRLQLDPKQELNSSETRCN